MLPLLQSALNKPSHIFKHFFVVTVTALVILSSVLASPPTSHAAENDWIINRFHSDIALQEDGSVQIKETIQVDFDKPKHGIFRTIPIRYQDKNRQIYTAIENIKVHRDIYVEPFQQSQSGNHITIKIGDPRIGDLKGKYTYTIDYQVKGVLRSYDGYDEFYWNSTGHDWPVSINQATASVRLPQKGLIQASCYQGSKGQNQKCSQTVLGDQEARFSATSRLTPQQGLTVAVGYQSGMVPIIEVPDPQVLSAPKQMAQIATAVVSTLIGLAGVWLLWYKKGRDWWWETPQLLQGQPAQAKLKPLFRSRPVVVEYTPPQNMTPGLLGLLKDEKADTLDVTASIVDLAVRGYLTITEIPKKGLLGSVDYQLQRTDKEDSQLYPYEQLLLKQLFASGVQVKMASLKNKFYSDLAKIKNELEKEGQRQKFFQSSPGKIRGIYLALGILLAVAGMIIISLSQDNLRLYLLLGLAPGLTITGIALAIASRFMPQKTAKGRDLWHRAQGYRLFLDTAEKHRQKFFEQKNLFQQALPYAMMFGMVEKYAKAMEDIGLQPDDPSWYHGSTAFNTAILAGSMSQLSKSMNSAIASAPSSSGSSGSGFSGGGFGGGGGGSW